MASLKEENAQLATLGMGVVIVVTTIISFAFGKVRRNCLLLTGFRGMLVVTVLLTLSLFFIDSFDKKMLSSCCILFVYLYMVFFVTGPGSIPWFLISEIFREGARLTAQSIATTVSWTANTIVTFVFLQVVSPYSFIFFIIVLVLINLFVCYIGHVLSFKKRRRRESKKSKISIFNDFTDPNRLSFNGRKPECETEESQSFSEPDLKHPSFNGSEPETKTKNEEYEIFIGLDPKIQYEIDEIYKERYILRHVPIDAYFF